MMMMIMTVRLYSCRSYPSSKLHIFRAALLCQLWRVRLYSNFPHYLIKDTIFGKKFLDTNCLF